MRILFIGPPLYGLLYPMVSLAHGFRLNGHDVVLASAGKFANKSACSGLTIFDAAPGLDSEEQYKIRSHDRKERNIVGNFSFFSEEMSEKLISFTNEWKPDLIVYPPLGPIGPLLSAMYDIPSIMQTVGFAHNLSHIDNMSKTLASTYNKFGISVSDNTLAWIDVAPPTMSILESGNIPKIFMQYVPYNGGALWQSWWERKKHRKRILVSLGTVKPMIDGLDIISWVFDYGHEIDAEIILQLAPNARCKLRDLPRNVRLVEWIPTGLFMIGADCFIHHGGAGNTLTALHNGIPQIIFGIGADRPTNAQIVADNGCGIIPEKSVLNTELIKSFLADQSFAINAKKIASEMSLQPSPAEVAKEIISRMVT